ncbi:MAG: hypothetical protein J7K58_04200 [Euryarchaeota archaeon]|nr:hypothetical protein [Euryarchaeota archaeon]
MPEPDIVYVCLFCGKPLDKKPIRGPSRDITRCECSSQIFIKPRPSGALLGDDATYETK